MAPSPSTMIDVRKLRLHSQNPRLPENLIGSSQTDLLSFLYANTALDELAKSFLDNGFFAHEPLIVSQSDKKGEHEVFEGNRRLAALTILLQLETAAAVEINFALDQIPTDKDLDRLREIPCVIVPHIDDVHRFLGFRHIGGIKTWSAEAKARYLLTEVNRIHQLDLRSDPFITVGRAVGSNAQGVRNPYIAMSILVKARDHFGIDISAIQSFRFGVWNRAMNSPDLRNYIGFGNARSYATIHQSLENLQEARLREVLGDLTPTPGSRRAVLQDSRDVTIYAQVLQNERAHTVLRQYDELKIARQIVEQAGVPQRIKQITDSVEVLNQEVSRQGAPEEAIQPARELANLARSLVALIAASVEPDD